MARTTTFALRDHVDDEWLLRLARIMSESPLHREPCFPGELEEFASVDNEELIPFDDVNSRCAALGYFSADERERRSRRIDLRGPTDWDPGPIEMAEGASEDAAIVLNFKQRD